MKSKWLVSVIVLAGFLTKAVNSCPRPTQVQPSSPAHACCAQKKAADPAQKEAKANHLCCDQDRIGASADFLSRLMADHSQIFVAALNPSDLEPRVLDFGIAPAVLESGHQEGHASPPSSRAPPSFLA